MPAPETYSEATTDAALVCAAATGDEAAFTELFHCHYHMIYSYAYRLSLRQADAEDIAQDTFIKAGRSLSHYRADAPFKNWLMRICTNSARDWARKRALRVSAECSSLEREAQREATRDTDHWVVQEALGALSPELRAAVVLVYYEGMNHAEAAAILECAESTVSWRVFRARRKLRSLLKDYERRESKA